MYEALKRGYISTNPFELVDLPHKSKRRVANTDKDKFYTKEQLKEFLSSAEKHPNYKVYAFFVYSPIQECVKEKR